MSRTIEWSGVDTHEDGRTFAQVSTSDSDGRWPDFQPIGRPRLVRRPPLTEWIDEAWPCAPVRRSVDVERSHQFRPASASSGETVA